MRSTCRDGDNRQMIHYTRNVVVDAAGIMGQAKRGRHDGARGVRALAQLRSCASSRTGGRDLACRATKGNSRRLARPLPHLNFGVQRQWLTVLGNPWTDGTRCNAYA